MSTSELQDSIIQKVLHTNDVQLLDYLNHILSSNEKGETYLLSGFERSILSESLADYKSGKTKELEHDTYPFKPELIKYRDKIFVLNKNLDCTVEFEDGNYTINNPELDLIVWGENRKEVEEALNFSFYSLFVNYYLEDDSKLSDEAIILKKKLRGLIKNVINEAQEN